jgi:CRP/FNR family transcriptional regulator, anaerobic regulatory protein
MKMDKHTNLFPVENNQTVCAECSIRRLALFHGVPENELSWTQAYRSDQFTIKARKELYRETQHSDYMFTVYHGWFAIFKTLDNGKRQILRIALPGDMIGFQANLEAPMTNSAMSLTDAVVCAFPRRNMPELLRKNSNVAKRLTEINARDMSICQSRLLTIGQQSAIERIAFFCTELFFRIKAIYNNKDVNRINFPISQEDIGDATGLTKIHVNRTLRSLREQGLMEISSKTLTIHKVEEMCKLANFEPSSINVYPLY